MIDTVTLTNTGGDLTLALGTFGLLLFLDLALFTTYKTRRNSDVAALSLPIVLVATVFVPIVLFCIPGTALAFDNNSGVVQEVKGREPIAETVLNGGDVVSTPCVLITGKDKTRHDCTFVKVDTCKYELWNSNEYKESVKKNPRKALP